MLKFAFLGVYGYTPYHQFYWKRMKLDIIKFCKSCDVCQKTKSSNFTKFGMLIPNPIPSHPYQSISMDFIVNLPWSEGYNAIYVVVNWLTKHASFIPMTTGLDAEGFTLLFVKVIACRFGLPESIITDRDPRWSSDFWMEVAKALRTKMSLSSSHHPQHDGQTEVVNKLLTTMLRAFVDSKKDQWSIWLHLLEFIYNSTVHSLTGTTPFPGQLVRITQQHREPRWYKEAMDDGGSWWADETE